MEDAQRSNLETHYQNSLQFTPGDTVNVYLINGHYDFTKVKSFRVLFPPGDENLLIIETANEHLVFREWLGVSVVKGNTEFNVF